MCAQQERAGCAIASRCVCVRGCASAPSSWHSRQAQSAEARQRGSELVSRLRARGDWRRAHLPRPSKLGARSRPRTDGRGVVPAAPLAAHWARGQQARTLIRRALIRSPLARLLRREHRRSTNQEPLCQSGERERAAPPIRREGESRSTNQERGREPLHQSGEKERAAPPIRREGESRSANQEAVGRARERGAVPAATRRAQLPETRETACNACNCL
jgi:hypothetical protein